ncbi:hypothetical protein [Chryseobacterium paludis]|uniref:hypothetical protein n=1 Tax=Chryseobacterium paludis TaxID=2956784 RepID=UPI0021C11D56|nr:hypothetical protein [Chryseobacterium paludis]
MKKLLFISSILLGAYLQAQVGINTTNPQQAFHIDGQKDNPATGAPTAAQQANDVVITSDGRIGAGVTTPTEKLDINGKARIRNTSTLTGILAPLFVDANGVVGKADASAPQAQIAFYTSESTMSAVAANVNAGQIQTVPVVASHAVLNTLGTTVPSSGNVRITQTGVYSLSASTTFNLTVNNDGDGFMYLAMNIDVSTDNGANWTAVAGGRPIFTRVSTTTNRNYPFIAPTVIKSLNAGDLIRLTYYRTLQLGSSYSAVGLASNYGAASYTLSISKL